MDTTNQVYDVDFTIIQADTANRTIDLAAVIDINDPIIQEKIVSTLNINRTKTFIKQEDLIHNYTPISAIVSYKYRSKTRVFRCRVLASSRKDAIEKAYLYYPSSQYRFRTQPDSTHFPEIYPLSSMIAKVSKDVLWPPLKTNCINMVKLTSPVLSQYNGEDYCALGLFIFDWSKFAPEEIEIQTALGQLNTLYRTCPMKINISLLTDLGLTIDDVGEEMKAELIKINTLPV